MAAEGWQQLWSYTAEASTVPDQYRIVLKGTGNHQVKRGTAGVGMGVCVNEPTAAGDHVDVVVLGITKVECGATIASGVRFTSDADGQAVAAASADDEVVGMTLTGATNAGELVTVLVCPVGIMAAGA